MKHYIEVSKHVSGRTITQRYPARTVGEDPCIQMFEDRPCGACGYLYCGCDDRSGPVASEPAWQPPEGWEHRPASPIFDHECYVRVRANWPSDYGVVVHEVEDGWACDAAPSFSPTPETAIKRAEQLWAAQCLAVRTGAPRLPPGWYCKPGAGGPESYCNDERPNKFNCVFRVRGGWTCAKDPNVHLSPYRAMLDADELYLQAAENEAEHG